MSTDWSEGKLLKWNPDIGEWEEAELPASLSASELYCVVYWQEWDNQEVIDAV